jgi:hypothetical protein
LGGWIKVFVTYLSSGRPDRGDDIQTAWTEVRALKQTLGDQAICLRDAREAASDGENAVVNAFNDLADTGARIRARMVA